MRILIDENLPLSLTRKLRESGYEVFDIRETGKTGITDDEIIKMACEMDCVLISANYKHFANILLFPPQKYQGIIVVKMPKSSIEKVVDRIVKVISYLKVDKIRNSIIIIEPTRIRIRK